MIRSITIIIVLTFIIHSSSCSGQNFKNPTVLGEENAKQAIKEAIKNKAKPFYDTLIKTKEIAIAMAEPILFDIYSKKQIINERPYECYLIDGYWYISGTLPKGWHGGVFEIIISSKDGQVIKLIHGK
jgi:NTF2 fold immunity protein